MLLSCTSLASCVSISNLALENEINKIRERRLQESRIDSQTGWSPTEDSDGSIRQAIEEEAARQEYEESIKGPTEARKGPLGTSQPCDIATKQDCANEASLTESHEIPIKYRTSNDLKLFIASTCMTGFLFDSVSICCLSPPLCFHSIPIVAQVTGGIGGGCCLLTILGCVAACRN